MNIERFVYAFSGSRTFLFIKFAMFVEEGPLPSEPDVPTLTEDYNDVMDILERLEKVTAANDREDYQALTLLVLRVSHDA